MDEVRTTLCASSREEAHWHSIDWAEVSRHVKRLQARIVKATAEGRWGKVNALQWLLTHSNSGKALAVRRVTENKGKATPGVDGVTWSTPKAKAEAMKSLQRRGYQPEPLRRVYIPKSNGKLRPLVIPTMKDRAMQALYLLALDPVAETKADRNSYGFRKARSAHDALEQCFTSLGKPTKSARWVLDADIKGCFDNIDHDWMIRNIPMDKRVLQKWLKAGYVERQALFPTEAGTPQGGIISPTLANIVLDGLERRLADRIRRRRVTEDGKQRTIDPKVNFIRYADDFVVTGDSPETLERAKAVVVEFLTERGLALSPEKTQVVNIAEGFDFLGQTVRLYGDKVLIQPSKDAQKRIYEKVRDIVQSNQSMRQRDLIRMLNPVIQGWVNYHRHAVSSVAFEKLDFLIWRLLWRWARRRHPGKGRKWVARRYWHRVGRRNWTFTPGVAAEGEGQPICLVYATDTSIRRHVKVKAELNPYAPEWTEYLAERHVRQGALKLNGRKTLERLWWRQEGICHFCDQPMERDEPVHVHHVQYRRHGGGDLMTNLVLGHVTCHRQHHSPHSVERPGPHERAFERLEPDAGKLARPVLRGEEHG